jgi:hypothetical protein
LWEQAAGWGKGMFEIFGIPSQALFGQLLWAHASIGRRPPAATSNHPEAGDRSITQRSKGRCPYKPILSLKLHLQRAG